MRCFFGAGEIWRRCVWRGGERGQAPAVDKPAEDTLALGDVVTMQGGAPVYGANKEFCSWVYSKNLYVRGIDGDKITVSIYSTGAVTGNVHRKYLAKV